MDVSSKRGKIPQKDWPLIIKRYEAGETLAAIARTYDCSPPAISYILSRSRARDAVADGARPDVTELSQPGLKTPSSDHPSSPTEAPTERRTAPQLVEAETSLPVEGLNPEPPQSGASNASDRHGGTLDEGRNITTTAASALPEGRVEIRQSLEPPKQEDVLSGNAPNPNELPQRGELRATLRLPLSHHGVHLVDPQHHEGRGSDASEIAAVRPTGAQPRIPFPAPAREQPNHLAAPNYGGTAARTGAEAERTADGSAFIDRVLRQRVDEDIAAFLAAFDAALAGDSLETRAALRQATDRLLRAGARTRIELERLEARVPLPAREKVGYSGPTWRPR